MAVCYPCCPRIYVGRSSFNAVPADRRREDAVSRGRVAQVFRRAVRLMPADGNIDEMVVAVGVERGRKIVIVQAEIEPSVSGLWVNKDEADYLFVDQNASPSRYNVIVCHELAHMLLGHDITAEGSALISALAPNLSPGLIARALARHSYDSADEAEAEMLATRLAAEQALRHRSAQPGHDVSRWIP